MRVEGGDVYGGGADEAESCLWARGGLILWLSGGGGDSAYRKSLVEGKGGRQVSAYRKLTCGEKRCLIKI